MSRAENINFLIRMMKHMVPQRFDDRIEALRPKLERYSARMLRSLRKTLSAFWELHDHSIEHARSFFSYCQDLYIEVSCHA
jgi:hypothetical protein